MKRVSRCFLLPAVLLLAACAAIAPQPEEAPAPPFEMNGRILVNDQQHRFTGNVRWEHGTEADDIWLAAPLGQTIAHMHAGPDGAVLVAADQTAYRAGSIESLTRRALGWGFPAAEMRHWLLGRPSPSAPVSELERDADQRVLAFTQGAWRVTLGYAEAGAQPSRLDVAGNGATMRLVVDNINVQAP
jgi:outer membrane lipoprotein LolB